jgi:hypothetical protein
MVRGRRLTGTARSVGDLFDRGIEPFVCGLARLPGLVAEIPEHVLGRGLDPNPERSSRVVGGSPSEIHERSAEIGRR